MNSFLYFIPNDKPDKAKLKLADYGLEHAFDAYRGKGVVHANGLNDGGKGIVLSGDPNGMPTLSHEQQTWKQVGTPGGPIWVGYWNNKKPTFESLARDEQLRGKSLRLSDGQIINVPVAITFDEVNGEMVKQIWLKRHITNTVSEDGTENIEIYGRIVEKFQPLFDMAMKWYVGDEEDDEESQMTAGDIFRMAGKCLSFNYRLSYPELYATEWFVDGDADKVLNIVVDHERAEAIQKKILDNALNSIVGSTDASPVTSPA